MTSSTRLQAEVINLQGFAVRAMLSLNRHFNVDVRVFARLSIGPLRWWSRRSRRRRCATVRRISRRWRSSRAFRIAIDCRRYMKPRSGSALITAVKTSDGWRFFTAAGWHVWPRRQNRWVDSAFFLLIVRRQWRWVRKLLLGVVWESGHNVVRWRLRSHFHRFLRFTASFHVWLRCARLLARRFGITDSAGSRAACHSLVQWRNRTGVGNALHAGKIDAGITDTRW